jgi:hypothetical protein
VAACVLAALAFAYWRLFYGIDFTDESYYVAVAYRFVLGAKPFVDETSVQQTTTGILLYPFVRLYHDLAGRTGIVLFVRNLHFAMALALGTVTWLALRRLLGLRTAALVGIAAFVFVPFDIPSVSYDSAGSAFFTAGCLLGFLARSDPRARLPAGIALGVAAFAYPPLLVGVVAVCALHLARRAWSLVATALGLPLAGFAALAATAGPGRIVDDYRHASRYTGEGGGLSKLREIAVHQWSTFPYWYAAAAVVVVLALTWRRLRPLAALAVALAPLAFFPPRPGWYAASLEYAAHLGWLAVPLAVGLRRDGRAVELFRLVWLPALVAGVTTAYSSGNGGVNLGVGFFPAAIAAVALAALAVQTLAPRRPELAALPVALAAGALAVFSLVPVYRDGSLATLDARVHGGPYAGLVTSDRKRAVLLRLEHDLTRVGPRCTLSAFADFPAGYLLTSARIDTNAVWTQTVTPAARKAFEVDLVRYYGAHGLPNVVIEMRRVPFDLPGGVRDERYAAGDPLAVLLRRRGYRETANRFDYAVYRRGDCYSTTKGGLVRVSGADALPRAASTSWIR